MTHKTGVSRRYAIRAGMGLIVSAGAVVRARAQEGYADRDDPPKLDRTVTKYQYHPNAEGSHCSICSNFIAPEGCKVIAGKIDPNGYCLAFAPLDQ